MPPATPTLMAISEWGLCDYINPINHTPLPPPSNTTAATLNAGSILPSSVPVGSQVQVELRLALNLEITNHPTHPTTPGKVEIQLEIDYIWSVD